VDHLLPQSSSASRFPKPRRAYVNASFRSTNNASDDVASSDDASNDGASSIDDPSGDDASSNRDANDDDSNGGGNTGESRRATFRTRR
jgi:hypothetical protein